MTYPPLPHSHPEADSTPAISPWHVCVHRIQAFSPPLLFQRQGGLYGPDWSQTLPLSSAYRVLGSQAYVTMQSWFRYTVNTVTVIVTPGVVPSLVSEP